VPAFGRHVLAGVFSSHDRAFRSHDQAALAPGDVLTPGPIPAPAPHHLEHRRCGELDSGISEDEPAWIVMACSCGAHLARRIEEEFFRSLSSRNRKREPRIRVVRGVLQVQVAVGLSPIGRPDDID
jgi:hypothetical protein